MTLMTMTNLQETPGYDCHQFQGENFVFVVIQGSYVHVIDNKDVIE